MRTHSSYASRSQTTGHQFIKCAYGGSCSVCVKCCRESEPVNEFSVTKLECGGQSYLAFVVLLEALFGGRNGGVGFGS